MGVVGCISVDMCDDLHLRWQRVRVFGVDVVGAGLACCGYCECFAAYLQFMHLLGHQQVLTMMSLRIADLATGMLECASHCISMIAFLHSTTSSSRRDIILLLWMCFWYLGYDQPSADLSLSGPSYFVGR